MCEWQSNRAPSISLSGKLKSSPTIYLTKVFEWCTAHSRHGELDSSLFVSWSSSSQLTKKLLLSIVYPMWTASLRDSFAGISLKRKTPYTFPEVVSVKLLIFMMIPGAFERLWLYMTICCLDQSSMRAPTNITFYYAYVEILNLHIYIIIARMNFANHVTITSAILILFLVLFCKSFWQMFSLITIILSPESLWWHPVITCIRYTWFCWWFQIITIDRNIHVEYFQLWSYRCSQSLNYFLGVVTIVLFGCALSLVILFP